MTSLLLYGSYGYVGRQVAREAVARDLPLRVAGRDYDRLVEQAEELDQPGRRFALNDPGAVRKPLEDVDCVLNCAGPFSNTAKSLVDGCIETGTDYVDITGEIPVIEQIADRDEAAADAGVTLLPAAGFSAVPMDCLAAHLVDRLPEASGLSLGVDSFRPPSIGSVRTVIKGIEDGGMIRRDDDLVDVPTAWLKAAMRTLMKEVGVLRIPATDLEEITVPTSLIRGRGDRAIRIGIAERASARYGWPLHVIEDAGDDPKLEANRRRSWTRFTRRSTTVRPPGLRRRAVLVIRAGYRQLPSSDSNAACT